MEKLPKRAAYSREQVPHAEERNVVMAKQAQDVFSFALRESFGDGHYDLTTSACMFNFYDAELQWLKTTHDYMIRSFPC